MSSGVVVINLNTITRIEENKERPSLVYRHIVVDAANSLLLAYDGSPEAAGVVALATALGCTVKQARR